MCERRDKADFLPRFFEPHIARRATGTFRQIGQRVFLAQLVAQFAELPVLAQTIFVADIAHWHHLDKGEVHVAVCAPFGDGKELVFVEAFERHRVDLDAKPGGLGGIDPFDHLWQAAPAGDVGEFLFIERVKGHVYAAHASPKKITRKARELRTVGGQREFLERSPIKMAGHAAEKRHDIPAHQRFPACDTQLFHTQTDKG